MAALPLPSGPSCPWPSPHHHPGCVGCSSKHIYAQVAAAVVLALGVPRLASSRRAARMDARAPKRKDDPLSAMFHGLPIAF